MAQGPVHHHACRCCGAFAPSRRGFIQAAAAAGAVSLAPQFVFAASGNYEAMVLSCIDPRLQAPVRRYSVERGLDGKYSQFVIAGAAIGVVAPAFKEWHRTFWDNLGASVQLHNIKRVVAISHRDCGAARIAYGEKAVTGRDAETGTHRNALAEFRKQMASRHPKLQVETLLMALDGSVETFA